MCRRGGFLHEDPSVNCKNLSIRRYLLGLGLVVLAAALVRCRYINQKSLWYWDEGIFIMGARFVRWRARFIGLQITNLFNLTSADATIANYQGFPVFLQKPAHVFLLAMFTEPFKNDVLAALMFSIVSGLISIVATAELARQWFSPVTGLLAAAFLAFMPSHVHYSRLALHEMDSMAAFLVLLLLLQTLQKERSSVKHTMVYPAATGFLAIMIIGMSYRYLPYICLAILIQAIRSGQKKSTRIKCRQWLWMLAGGATSFILLNIGYRLAFFPEFSWSEPSNYVSVLKTKFLGSESSFDLAHPFYYLSILFQFDGVLPTLSWLISLPLMVYRLNYPRLQCLAYIVAPLALFSLTTTRVPRSITGIYPFIAIAWGYMITLIGLAWKHRQKQALFALSTMAIAGITLSTMIIRLPAIWSVKTGYQDTIKWLQATGDERHFSTMFPVYAVYQGNQMVYPAPPDMQTLKNAVKQTGIRYLTVDWQKYLRYQSSVYQIERQALPVAAFEHRPGDFLLSLYENHLPADVPILQQDPALHTIKIYDLYAVLPEMGYPLSSDEKDHD